MKNINKNKNTTKLPMPGKVKKGFRFYCAVVMALAFTLGCSMTAFAAGDPITVVNNLSDFIFGLIRAGRPVFSVPRPQPAFQRISHPCSRHCHHLCKGNPYPDYRLKERKIAMEKCECYIHSLKQGETHVLGEATIIKRLGDNDYLAEYNGVKCHAIFNPFAGRYFVDDVYGVIRNSPDRDSR